MITGFHHLTAVTKDAEKNKTFYTDILGLRLVKQTVNPDNLTDSHLQPVTSKAFICESRADSLEPKRKAIESTILNRKK